MPTLTMPRGSVATGLPGSPAQDPDLTPADAGRVPGARSTAPPHPERVKQKSSTTMTTTASPPMETTAVPRVETTPRTTTRARRPRRTNAFWAFLADDQRDLNAQQREALLRLQLR